MDSALTPRQQAFVDQYLIDRNATQAAIRAGYSAKTAETQGPRLYRNAQVRAAIDAAIEKQKARTEVTADWVLRRLFLIAGADPNELIQHRRIACRDCHDGNDDVDRTDLMRAPDRDCHGCHGRGVGYVHVCDTTKLSEGANALFAGVKTTKDGIEIKMHDQMAALEKIGRHLGMFDPKNQPGTAENPLALLIQQVQGTTLPIVHHVPSPDDDEEPGE